MRRRKFSELERHWVAALTLVVAIGVIAAVGGIIVFTGLYNIAADAPHTKAVYWFVQAVKDRSIAVRSRDIQVPTNLSDPKRIAAGAGLYAEMCSGCHLAPGMERTEISQGLYPRAPEFSRGNPHGPADEFWIIKHGLKLTGMAAWGPTHNNTLIWDMVAFLQKLPSLTPEQYRALIKSAPESHEEMMKGMPGMHSDVHGDHHD